MTGDARVIAPLTRPRDMRGRVALPRIRRAPDPFPGDRLHAPHDAASMDMA